MAITKLNSQAIPPNTIVESDLSYPLTNFSSTGIDDNATSTAITIDSSQNVGISRTPSAWASSLQVTQNGVQGLWTASTGQNSSIGSNLYYDSSVQGRYITDGEAAQYQHFEGTHRWYNAPSGTAGALINGTGNLTQLARLDSDGLKFGSDSAAANALDDYEEGTWTATLSTSNGDGTYSITTAASWYTKIGNIVSFGLYASDMDCTSVGTGSYLLIGGLPYNMKAYSGAFVTFGSFYTISDRSITSPNSNSFRCMSYNSGSYLSPASAGTFSNKQAIISGTYAIA